MDLGEVRGWERGGGRQLRETVEDAFLRSGAQRREAESCGWRVREMSRWVGIGAGRGGGLLVKHIERVIRQCTDDDGGTVGQRRETNDTEKW